MAELLTAIPGDIPGLLLRGAPVVLRGPIDPPMRGTVTREPVNAQVWVCWQVPSPLDEPAFRVSLLLDLTDATGAAMAGAWLLENAARRVRCSHLPDNERLVGIGLAEQACTYQPLSSELIDTLARLVLRLAGRS